MILLTLPEVAGETRQPEHRLRRWCATGKLRCERDGPDWVIPSTELPVVVLLGRGAGRSASRRPLVGLALPGPHDGVPLAAELATLLGVDATAVAVRDLAIDGEPYILATWGTHPGPAATGRLEQLALARGGELLEEGRPTG
ncbi:MAG: hypothetical protein HY263_05885 [Chloroflexi bacterium]|nr:hypothetical protein [Chloroflexota bacterium]